MFTTIKNFFYSPLYWLSKIFVSKTSEQNGSSFIELLTIKWKTADFTIRPLNEMFVKNGFSYPVVFSDTFHTNLYYYSANYFIFTILMFLYICFTLPLFLFASVTSAGLYYYQGFDTHVIGGSLVILTITGGTTLLTVLLLTLGSIGLHSVFRKPFVSDSEKTD